MRAFFLLASVGLVACSTNVEPTNHAPAAGTPVGAEPTVGEARVVHEAQVDLGLTTHEESTIHPSGFACRLGAFCEDFEAAAYAPRWAGMFTTGGGTIELGTDSASLGHGSLRLTTKDAASSAYLLKAGGDVGDTWSGAISFALRVDQVPAKYFGGPEFTLKTADGPLTLRVSMRPEGVYLEQRSTAACLRDRCQTQSTLIAPAKANHWYRLTVGVEANAQPLAPYGRVEATLDGGDTIATDLSVPLYSGSAFLFAGINEGDPAQRVFADLDDVSLLLR